MDTLTGRSHIVDPAAPHLGGNLIGGDPRCWFPDLWAWLIQRFDVRFVLDVGCGEGYAVDWFIDHDISACGLDGLWWNVERCAERLIPAIHHDLTVAPYIGPASLVWCCEVVEHIEERYLDNLLDTLANGRVIAMTHALPGQDGHHHVNCQPADYWIGHIERRGYRVLEAETNRGRSYCPHGYFGLSGLIFARAS